MSAAEAPAEPGTTAEATAVRASPNAKPFTGWRKRGFAEALKARVAKPLALEWVFGLHKDGKGVVHNLSADGTTTLFYAVANTGILYDATTHTQRVLQGHRNTIIASSCSANRRFIVTVEEDDGTAAEGSEALMIVWDTVHALPIKTIPVSAHGGIRCCDMSADGTRIATVSNTVPQRLALWDWTVVTGSDEPKLVRDIPAQDEQTVVRFHPEDDHLVLTNGLRRILFWSWEEGEWKYYSPPITVKHSLGHLTQSAFVPGTTMACSGTVDGDVVLWEVQPSDRMTKIQDKTLRKTVRVHANAAVTYVGVASGYIVTGGADGHVRFLDSKLRLVSWFEDLGGGPIVSISLDRDKEAAVGKGATATPSRNSRASQNSPGRLSLTKSQSLLTGAAPGADTKAGSDAEATVGDSSDVAEAAETTSHTLVKQNAARSSIDAAMEFEAPDFIVATANAMIIKVFSTAFHSTNVAQQRGLLLAQGQDDAILALAAHPSKPWLAISGRSGNLHLWDYDAKAVLLLRLFPGVEVRCMAFHPQGNLLATGFSNGTVKLLDVATLEERQTLRCTKGASLLSMTFSLCGEYMAVSDADMCVGVLRCPHPSVSSVSRGGGPRVGPSPTQAENAWCYIGRHKAHCAPVVGLQFAAGGACRLFSLGADKRLVEYNVMQSEEERGLLVLCAHSVSQGPVPTGLFWTPQSCLLDPASVPREVDPGKPLDLLGVATNEYKLQVHLTDWRRQCVKTVLGPTFGGPMTRLAVAASPPLSQEDGADASSSAAPAPPCLVYASSENVIGLVKLPLNGDPTGAMGIFAHPREVAALVTSFDWRYVFSAGGEDQSVMQWRIDHAALERINDDGRSALEHYVDAVDGGADGELMREILDYFYYAQIRAQGEETTAKRKILGAIPFSQVPDLCRALGLYPSELDIQRMTYEVETMYAPREGAAAGGGGGGGPRPPDEAPQPLISFTGGDSAPASPASVAPYRVDDQLLNFSEFLRLYINHRPVYSVTNERIEAVFATLGADPITNELDRDVLFNMLSSRGEMMRSSEVASALRALLGDDVVLDMLEDRISARAFSENLLGFEAFDVPHADAPTAPTATTTTAAVARGGD